MRQENRNRLYLVLSIACIAIVWTVALPWLGERSPLRSMIERNEARGIDPTAMFYTELENMRFRDGRMRRVGHFARVGGEAGSFKAGARPLK